MLIHKLGHIVNLQVKHAHVDQENNLKTENSILLVTRHVQLLGNLVINLDPKILSFVGFRSFTLPSMMSQQSSLPVCFWQSASVNTVVIAIPEELIPPVLPRNYLQIHRQHGR